MGKNLLWEILEGMIGKIESIIGSDLVNKPEKLEGLEWGNSQSR